MRHIIRMVQRDRVTRALDENRSALLVSLTDTPDDVIAREPLWMERHRLLRQREVLS